MVKERFHITNCRLDRHKKTALEDTLSDVRSQSTSIKVASERLSSILSDDKSINPNWFERQVPSEELVVFKNMYQRSRRRIRPALVSACGLFAQLMSPEKRPPVKQSRNFFQEYEKKHHQQQHEQQK